MYTYIQYTCIHAYIIDTFAASPPSQTYLVHCVTSFCYGRKIRHQNNIITLLKLKINGIVKTYLTAFENSNMINAAIK